MGFMGLDHLRCLRADRVRCARFVRRPPFFVFPDRGGAIFPVGAGIETPVDGRTVCPGGGPGMGESDFFAASVALLAAFLEALFTSFTALFASFTALFAGFAALFAGFAALFAGFAALFAAFLEALFAGFAALFAAFLEESASFAALFAAA